PVELHRGTPEFDLILNMSESNHELFGRLEYRTDLFNTESMIQFLHHFETVIRQIVALPNTRLDELKAVLAVTDREARNARKQELRQVGLQKLGQVRRKAKQSENQREEISHE
ncbi:MAG TPA: condensation domain-containing protein, partial [Ktedonobacteraceae bacterium]|nr:condensation domain-containing protein [Ktedonobacteraceae bacterium]